MFLSPVHHSCWVFSQSTFLTFCPLLFVPIFPAFHYNLPFSFFFSHSPLMKTWVLETSECVFWGSGFQPGWFLGSTLSQISSRTHRWRYLAEREWICGILNKCMYLTWPCLKMGLWKPSAIIWLTSVQWKVNLHTEWSKSEKRKTNGQLLTHIWNLEKIGIDEPFTGQE